MMEKLETFARKLGILTAVVLIPALSFAQKSDSTAWVPFNAAGNLQNDPIQLVFRPNEVGVTGTVSEKQVGAGLLVNYYAKIGNEFVVGTGINASRAQGATGATNVLGMRVGVGKKIGNGNVQIGVKMQTTGTDKSLVVVPPSILVRYVNKHVRIGTEIDPKKVFGALFADVFVARNFALSGTMSGGKGVEPKVSFGAEARVYKGWQVGASVHPERGFFGGKVNPCLTIRKTNKKSTFNIAVSPQQKKVTVGVGMRF